VFLRAIRETAAGDYSPDQVAAWAAEHGDLAAWAASHAAAHTQVAIIDGRVARFTDLDDDGYEDMLFVDPRP
jgi:putative acetyltransferase